MLCAVLLVGCGAAPQPPPASIAHALLGKPVSYELPTSDGRRAAIPAAGAQATLIEFWVTYCKGCGRSLPRAEALIPTLRERGVKLELVGVFYDDEDLARVMTVVQRWGVTTPFAIDRGGNMWRQFHVPVPGFVVLDRHGKVRWIAPANANEKQAAEVALEIAQETP